MAAATLLWALAAGCTTGASQGAPSDAGVAAYRNKDFATAWSLLEPLARRGHFRAQRYVAFMLMQGVAPTGCAPEACIEEAKALIMDSARRGDTNSLIVMEAMRSSGEAFAPTDAEMIAVDRARALAGDPMSGWRLAQRYADGDGVEASAVEAAKFLKVAAKGDPAVYPNSATAAFRLCDAYANGDGVGVDLKAARKWCKRAADAGHAGAVVALAQLEKPGRGLW